MKKLKKGWKVLTNKNYSAVQDYNRGGLRYKEGEFVVPRKNCGPLTVFKTKKAAEFFRTGMYNFNSKYRIKPCIYIQSKKRDVWYRSGLLLDSKLSLKELYKYNSLKPRSVALADKVKILKSGGKI
jgi:hypothetical protein